MGTPYTHVKLKSGGLFNTGDYFLYPGCSVEVIVSNITNASNAFLDPIRNCSPYEGMAFILSAIRREATSS